MRRLLLFCVLTACLTLTAAEAVEFDGYLVLLDTDAPVSLLSASEPEFPEITEVYAPAGVYQVKDAAALGALRDCGALISAEPNYIVTLDDIPGAASDAPDGATLLDASEAQWYDAPLELDWVRARGFRGEGVRVGIVDSGIFKEHQEFQGVKVLDGANYCVKETDAARSDVSDSYGHGTFVSGLIAAAENGVGIAGIAPEVELVPLKCFEGKNGSVANIASAIYDAVDTWHCQVLNLSLGLERDSSVLRAAVEYADKAGVVMAAAAGNTHSLSQGDVLNYPAAYDSVIGVGSVDSDLSVSSFSQRNQSVEIVAPGRDLRGPSLSSSTGYATGYGTSYASPMVAAAAALLLAARPGLDKTEFRDFLINTASDAGDPGYDIDYGYGILHVGRLLSIATGMRHTVTFNANGGSVSPSSKFVEQGEPYGELPMPTRDGYAFDGWFTAANGGRQVTPETTVNLSGSQTLYAHWTAGRCVVTFDANGGSVSQSSKIVTQGGIYGELPTPTRDGYRFDGWFTAGGGKQITASTLVNLSGNQTLYAHWTANSYIVTFYANGGSVSPSSKIVTQGELYWTLPTPTRDGYTFAGWFTDAIGGTQVTAETTVNLSDNQALYAHWTKPYVVTFNANGGSVSQSSKTVTQGETYGALPTPTRNGYAFAGWFDALDGGTQITASTTVNLSDNQTLYAHWTANSYSVTFNANGGSVSQSSKSVTQGETYGALPTPTRDGYSFDGWFTAASGGTQVTAETTVNLSGSQELYAHWTANSYSVTFNANGGSVSQSSIVVAQGGTYGALPTPTRDGYSFDGWFTAASGGTQVTAETAVNLSGSQELFAHWTKIYVVTFNANGGSVSQSSKTVTQGGTYGALPAPTRNGYAFAGWFDAIDGGTQVTASTTVNLSDNQTLYAHWTANSYSVTFNANGGTVSQSSKTVTQGETYGALPTPTRDGYAFAGWFDAASGGTQVTASTAVNLSGSQTLYAHWMKMYVVTFNANGGSVSQSSKSVTQGETYGALPAPTRAGYSFDGWFAATDGGTQVTSETIVSLSDNQELFARWTPLRYVVTFNANGGSVSPERKEVTQGGAYGALPAPTRAGYIFSGWFTATDGGTQVTPKTTVNLSDNQELFARWKLSVTFDANGGSVSPDRKEVANGGTYGELPVPTRAGYVFDGWYTAIDGGTQVTAANAVHLSSPQTLYAHWRKDTVTYSIENERGETFDVTDISQLTPGSTLTVEPDALEGDFKTASVFCAVYDRQGAMVRLQVWEVDLTDPLKVAMSGAIRIPENVEVGEIRVFILSENLVPLCAAEILK